MNEHVHEDIRRASTLPKTFYTSQHIHDQLRERAFARSWQFVGSTPELVRAPGDVAPIDLLPGLLDEPVLLTRDLSDQLHCLSNVCTHRGNLVAAHAGKCRTLRCAYHGRRFALNGTFEYMPEFESAECFPSSSDNLPRIPFAQWGPFLFASLDPQVPFAEFIAPIVARLGWLPLNEFRFDASRSRDYLVQANWALYCDNYLEGFHIPYVHAGLNAMLDYGDYSTELYPWANLQLGIAKGGECCFELPPESPDHGREIAAYYYWLFPNTMLNFYPWGLSVNVVRPLGVDRTKVSFLTYVWNESKLDKGAGAGLDRVEREDEAVVESVQRGIRSRLYRAGRFSPAREQGVHHFHRLLQSFIES